MESELRLARPDDTTISKIFRYLKQTCRAYIKHRYILLLLLPTIIWFLIFRWGPMYGVQIAFRNFRLIDGITGSPWVGLQHFYTLFTASPDFIRILINTIWISFLRIVLEFPAPIIFALLLNELWSRKFMKITQNFSYLPFFFTWVVLAAFWFEMLSPSTGIVNQILIWLGFQPIHFMAEPSLFRSLLVSTSILRNVGWDSIIYMAALSSIDPELYEAARIDGAGRLKQALHISIPCIFPMISIMLIIRTGGILDAGFDQIFNMMTVPTMRVADVIDTYVYRLGLQKMQYDLSTAIGLFRTVISFGLVLIVNKVLKSMGQEGLF